MQLHPVADAHHVGPAGGLVVGADLVDHKGTLALPLLHQRVIAFRAVGKARCGVEGALPAAVLPGDPGHIGLPLGAAKLRHRGAQIRQDLQRLPLGESKIGVAGQVLAGEEEQGPLPGLQLQFRKDPEGLLFGIPQHPAAEIHGILRDVLQLQPVGKVPVLIGQGGPVFHHQLRDPDFLRVFILRGGRGRKGRFRHRRGQRSGRFSKHSRRRGISCSCLGCSCLGYGSLRGNGALLGLMGGKRPQEDQRRRQYHKKAQQDAQFPIPFSAHDHSSNPTQLQNIIAQKPRNCQ